MKWAGLSLTPRPLSSPVRPCREPISVKSGVRQGCQLSPSLFILAIEPLACALRHEKNIRGLPIPGATGKEAKLSLYIDDLTLLLNDNKSISETLNICDVFTLASGTKINKNKCEILYLNWREPVENLGLLQKNETIKVLGVQIGKDMEKINWESKLQKIRGKLLQWKDRDLSMIGKVLVLKAEIIASLTHLAATLPLEKGGRGVPEIESKLKAMFVTPMLKKLNFTFWCILQSCAGGA
uniref:Reverse transcriptase domain-containing protein n=1 Tax=Gouania willdenowi TaxID=441366 RepID=A0A8C5E1P6_GOUWI